MLEGELSMNQISGFNFLRQGKVRDVYAVDNNRHLLIIVSDRISAFDADAEISNVSYGL